MRPASKRRSGGAFSGVSIIVKRGVKLNCIIIFFIELNESGVNKVLFASLLPQFVFYVKWFMAISFKSVYESFLDKTNREMPKFYKTGGVSNAGMHKISFTYKTSP